MPIGAPRANHDPDVECDLTALVAFDEGFGERNAAFVRRAIYEETRHVVEALASRLSPEIGVRLAMARAAEESNSTG
jgi:hypothetical protein